MATAAAADEDVEGPEGNESAEANANVYNLDMNLLKDAALSFARDRFDIFK